MILITGLRNTDKGRWVTYDGYRGEHKRGRIKSWNDIWIFVVYKCDDDWDNYQKYTGAATKPSQLTFVESEASHEH